MADFEASIGLGTLNGITGFRLDGIDAGDQSGRSVSNAGDVNGDGFADIIIGAFGGNPGGDSFAGESYVLFGKAGGFAASLSLATLTGADGFRIDGIDASDQSGVSVSAAGDVNGDGYDDILIGARGGDPGDDSYAGESYVVFGKADGFAPSLDLATLTGANGFRIDGIDAGDQSGVSVSSAGDVNGDGYDDIVIGADGADPGGSNVAGESYVVFGKADGFAASLDLAALTGADGFRIDGIDGYDYSGFSVSGAGDVNGDGFDDILIGASGGDTYSGFGAGESYVVFGKADGFAASLDLATLDGTNGFRIDGIDFYDQSGVAVSDAGDVNGDGFDDILIGAPSADPGGIYGAGETYVVFGKDGGFDASLDLADLVGTNGFRIDGIDTYGFSGRSISGAGDVNGDGFDDILIGAFSADPGSGYAAGESYVVFGKADGFAANIELASLTGANGFRIDGIDTSDQSGYSVSGAGDVDGDGFDDILIGAKFADPGGDSSAGESYVLFGRAPGEAVLREGAGGDQAIRGGAFDDTLLGAGGNDTLHGAGGNDLMRGQGGADQMTGGEGDDIYWFDNAGDVAIELADGGADTIVTRVDLTGGVTGIERIKGVGTAGLALSAGGDTTQIIGGEGGDTLTGAAAADLLRGGLGDDRLEASAGGDYLDGGEGADTHVLDLAFAGTERARIAGFAGGEDTIEIDAAVFGGGLAAGPLDPGAFVAHASAHAVDGDTRFIYDTRNGVLRFDPDGTGAQAATDIAKLLGAPTLDADDFTIVDSGATAGATAAFGHGRAAGFAEWAMAETALLAIA